jgi:hypothetical protein
MAKTPESIEHIKVFDWIQKNEELYPVLKTIFHCPSSFFGTNFGVIVWLKKLGFRRGIYDLIIPVAKCGYSGYWIEFKAEKKKLSKDQAAIKDLINLYSDNPTKFEVFYDADSCINSIKDYLTL